MKERLFILDSMRSDDFMTKIYLLTQVSYMGRAGIEPAFIGFWKMLTPPPPPPPVLMKGDQAQKKVKKKLKFGYRIAGNR